MRARVRRTVEEMRAAAADRYGDGEAYEPYADIVARRRKEPVAIDDGDIIELGAGQTFTRVVDTGIVWKANPNGPRTTPHPVKASFTAEVGGLYEIKTVYGADRRGANRQGAGIEATLIEKRNV